jgi:hypothetical protein
MNDFLSPCPTLETKKLRSPGKSIEVQSGSPERAAELAAVNFLLNA